MSGVPKRRASPPRKAASMHPVAESDTRPNEIEVGLKQACQTGTLGSLTATRPEAMAPSAAAKKSGARTEEMPKTTPALRCPRGPAHTWRKANNAPRKMRASRATPKSGETRANTDLNSKGEPAQ